MAAGTSSRFAPLSYETHKSLLTVRGEVLIERQIRQIRDAGIDSVVLVGGYMKERFAYLREKFGVTIVDNPEYTCRNNHSSIYAARHLLGNSYICSSDNYFSRNPFESCVDDAYYAALYADGPTSEWCVYEGDDGYIDRVSVGGENAWYMIGHVFFDKEFSTRFREILEDEYDLPQTRDKLWEDLYVEHIKELDMRIRRYDPPIIREFDSLDELRDFDPLFLENLDSEIFDNIVAVLGCKKSEIHDVYPLKQGLTNLSCHFATNDGEWVYRHPGVGTELLINRTAEKTALETARQLGLDDTFVFENARRGWKISKYIPHCKNLDAHDDSQLEIAMVMARKLHESGAKVERSFSFYTEGKRYECMLKERGPIDVSDWQEMSSQADMLNNLISAEAADPVLCHNDFFGLNFLVAEDDRVSLIDWEYAGMGDYANDFGTFCVCEQLDEERMRKALGYYFGRTPTASEWRHNLAQVGLAGWCWYAWSLLKEAEGEHVGEWAYIYYRYGKTYLKKALDLYNQSEQ